MRLRKKLDHIEAHLEDLKSGKTNIFISTTVLAEIRTSKVQKSGKTPLHIFHPISAVFKFIPPSPDIISLAGHLRDQVYKQVAELEYQVRLLLDVLANVETSLSGEDVLGAAADLGILRPEPPDLPE